MKRFLVPDAVMALIAVVSIASMYGCATRKEIADDKFGAGISAYKPITPNSQVSYQLAPDESANEPKPIGLRSPVYPEELVSLNLPPVDIAAQLIMDKQGNVTEVRIAPYLGNYISHRKEFEAAVKRAALTWKFTPLVFTRTVATVGGPDRTIKYARPFSLWYMFHFEVKGGKAIGSVAPGGPTN